MTIAAAGFLVGLILGFMLGVALASYRMMNLHFHAHGISDPDRFTDHVMRKIPEALKRTSPGYSPFSK
jgi:hypothetical protein